MSDTNRNTQAMRAFLRNLACLVICTAMTGNIAVAEAPGNDNNQWSVDSLVMLPGPKGSFDEVAVKDPSVVYYDGKWHVFYTARSKEEYTTGYVSAETLPGLQTAPRHELKMIRGQKRYACAPQVFYYEPQQKWYLIFQNRDATYQPMFSTTSTISDPESWSAPEPLLTKDTKRKWIDFWIICDEKRAYLFYTMAHSGVMVRSTSLAEFPKGWGKAQKVFDNIHEAVHVYKAKGSSDFYMIYELEKEGVRTFGLATAPHPEGPWKKVTDHYATGDQLRYREESGKWTEMVSHGEVLRSGYDQNMEFDPQGCQWLIQGITNEEMKGHYDLLPWKLGVITKIEENADQKPGGKAPDQLGVPSQAPSTPELGVKANPPASHSSTIRMTSYGKLPDGREVQLYTLTNKNGMVAKVMDYGAHLVGLEVPDAKGKLEDVTLGYDTLAGWLTNTSYFGATVGRFANRIAHGKFSLDGVEYTLAKNNEPGGIPCHLHGGDKGFDKVLWKGEPVDTAEGKGVKLTYVSKNGEEGYPGNLTTTVTYLLTDANELVWEAEATTDSPTIVNLAHHSYWNLSGNPKSSINDHELMLAAPGYLPTNAGLIPTGKIEPVAGTPMDFTKPTRIGDRVDADFEALRFGGGYDHCWVLEAGKGMKLAARLKDPKSGRVMEIFTDQPGIQFYGGNFLDGTVKGKGGVEYARRSGLCLETEGFPDAPNQPAFPSSVLRPGETYRHKMVHRFCVE